MYRLLRGFFIDGFLGTEDFVHAVRLILLCYVATLPAIGALEPPHYGSPFLSLSSRSLAPACSCRRMLCTVRGAATIKGDAMEELVAAATAANPYCAAGWMSGIVVAAHFSWLGFSGSVL